MVWNNGRGNPAPTMLSESRRTRRTRRTRRRGVEIVELLCRLGYPVCAAKMLGFTCGSTQPTRLVAIRRSLLQRREGRGAIRRSLGRNIGGRDSEIARTEYKRSRFGDRSYRGKRGGARYGDRSDRGGIVGFRWLYPSYETEH